MAASVGPYARAGLDPNDPNYERDYFLKLYPEYAGQGLLPAAGAFAQPVPPAPGILAPAEPPAAAPGGGLLSSLFGGGELAPAEAGVGALYGDALTPQQVAAANGRRFLGGLQAAFAGPSYSLDPGKIRSGVDTFFAGLTGGQGAVDEAAAQALKGSEFGLKRRQVGVQEREVGAKEKEVSVKEQEARDKAALDAWFQKYLSGQDPGAMPGYGGLLSTGPSVGGGGTTTGPGTPAQAGQGGRLGFGDLRQLAVNAGFQGEKADQMAAISLAESGGDPYAHGDKSIGGSYGVTQIHRPAHGDKALEAYGNPARAMELAFNISKGGTDFSPWTMYKNGGYRQFLPQVQARLDRAGSGGGTEPAQPAPGAGGDAVPPAGYGGPSSTGGLLPPLPGGPGQRSPRGEPPGTPINSRGLPYSPELLNMPPDQRARMLEAEKQLRAGTFWGPPAPAGAPGILSPPAQVGAGPRPMAPQAPPPQLQPGPGPGRSSAPTEAGGLDPATRQAIGMQYFGGRLGIPGLGGIMTGSPAYQGQVAEAKKRVDLQFLPQEEAIKNLSKYLSPEANVELQRAIASAKAEAEQQQARITQGMQPRDIAPGGSVFYPPGSPGAAQFGAQAPPPGTPQGGPGPGVPGPTPAATPGAGPAMPQALPPPQPGAGVVGPDGGVTVRGPRADESTFAVDVAKQASAGFWARRQAAEKMSSSLDTLGEAKKLLDSGIYTGRGAELKLEYNKLWGLAGATPEERVANTETFLATRARNVQDMIGVLGSANAVSNLDLKFTEEAAARKITFDERTIRRLFDIEEKYGRQLLERFNRDAEQVQKAANVPYQLTVDLPNWMQQGQAPGGQPGAPAPTAAPAPAPAARSPAAGTVQDGYQFLGGDPAKPQSWRKVE